MACLEMPGGMSGPDLQRELQLRGLYIRIVLPLEEMRRADDACSNRFHIRPGVRSPEEAWN